MSSHPSPMPGRWREGGRCAKRKQHYCTIQLHRRTKFISRDSSGAPLGFELSPLPSPPDLGPTPSQTPSLPDLSLTIEIYCLWLQVGGHNYWSYKGLPTIPYIVSGVKLQIESDFNWFTCWFTSRL